jgi:hypothetical protein
VLAGPTEGVLRVVPLQTLAGSHDARSAYVERYWLPLLGPSATWLLRLIAAGFDAHPGGFDLDMAATAAALGLAKSRVHRALDRLVIFGLAEKADGGGTVAVRRLLPALPPHHARRLPSDLARELLRSPHGAPDHARGKCLAQ